MNELTVDQDSLLGKVGRKDFLKTGVAAGAAAVLLGHQAPTSAGADETGTEALAAAAAFGPNRFALTLDGAPAGYLHEVEGGAIYADVVSVSSIESAFPFKNITGPKYEDLSVRMGFGLTPAVYARLAGMINGDGPRSGVRISSVRPNGAVADAVEFFRCLISEVAFPECDAAERDPGYLAVTFSPEGIAYQGGIGAGPTVEPQKPWHPANFSLAMGGLPCSRVAKIEALAIKQKITEFHDGAGGPARKVAGGMEYPNLVFYVPVVDAQPFYDWFDDFVVKGQNGNAQEKDGSLRFLADNKADELARLDFYGSGIYKLTPDSGNSRNVRRIKVELYCERMAFHYGPAGAG